jgi:DNA (cytosine-5)-methyltransferase 1
MKSEAGSIHLIQKGFTFLTITYHINDYVYIQPASFERGLLLKIGQIVGISGPRSDITIQIRYLRRYTYEERKNLMVDEVCQKYLTKVLK